MKTRISKRILAGLLTFGMAASMMPANVFAAQSVTSTPGNTQMSVEYFSSTLYNWDEQKANEAAAAADYTNGTVYQGANVYYSTVATQNKSTYTATNYWYKADDGQYYPVYYTRTTSGWWGSTTTYTLYRKDGNSYRVIGKTTSGYDTIYLYTQSSGGYEGKGFYFTEAGGKQNAPSFSQWSGGADNDGIAKQNYYIYSGLAEKNLEDSENAPFSNENVNAANLFATDESNEDYTSVYTNVKVPFVYDEDSGYYELNSDKWAVYFNNGNAASNATMNIADKPVSFNTGSGRDPMCGFQPFEKVSNRTQTAYLGTAEDRDDTTSSYSLTDGNDGATYGFGMVTSVNFQMTDNGKDSKGNDIEFSFSGDDDVWVYVDDVLALDIGGTHDAITGTINFATGDVTLSADKYGKVGDKATDPSMTSPSQGTLQQTNLYESLGTTLTGFASQGTHKLTIYYMDRGRGATNCLIKFNLPQRDTVSVTKQIDQSKDNEGNKSPLTEKEQASVDNQNFGFTIYEGDTALSNKTYYIYENNNIVGTASTNRYGHFTLKNNQTARFNVDISETGKNYHIVEDNLTEAGYKEPEYSYSSTISGATVTEEANGYTGMTVQASGSSTAADSISFVCENFLDSNLPNPGAALADDTYVIDYGLPVKFENVMENDIWRGESAEVTKVEEIGDYISESGTYGETELNEDGSITYTLSKPLDRVVTLEYTVDVTGKGNSGTEEQYETIQKKANIYIVPATSMYYEENFSDMIKYSDGHIKWTDVKDDKSYGTYQEQGEMGDPNDSTYGTDTVYLNNLGDSYGTSRHVTTDNTYSAQFSYEFTGTGTAIYSRISQDSAYIRVEIAQNGENVDRQYIDTRMVGDVAANQTLYNIPVYNNSGLDYGTYEVTVTVYKSGTPVNGNTDSAGNLIEGSDKSGSEFYLDGIRVYQPLIDDARAEDAYAADGESNISLLNIRSKIVADAEALGAEDFITLTDSADSIIDVESYKSIGPNEELYLNEGDYNVSFYLLNWDSKNYHLYLGMKTPGNTAAQVKVGDNSISINNSADCYYDVSDYVTVEMVDLDDDGVEDAALGTLTVSAATGLVSLSNIKVTGVDWFDIGYSSDLDVEDIDARTLYLLPSNYSFKGDTEEDTPAETEIFEPEKFEINTTYVKLTKKATVKVATSTDVAYITINGERVEPGKAGNSYVFTATYTKAVKGTAYEIIAYNTDGVASETYTAIAD